jgi:uncharacterized membrane protein
MSILGFSLFLTLCSVAIGSIFFIISKGKGKMNKKRFDRTGNFKLIIVSILLLLIIPIPFMFIEKKKDITLFVLAFLMITVSMHLLFLIIQRKKNRTTDIHIK